MSLNFYKSFQNIFFQTTTENKTIPERKDIDEQSKESVPIGGLRHQGCGADTFEGAGGETQRGLPSGEEVAAGAFIG